MTFELLIANLIVAFAAFVQASVGIGFAMIAVPLLVLIDLAYAPGPAVFLVLVLALIMVAGSWRDVDTQGLLPLVPGLLAGTVAGALLLGALDLSLFGLVFGMVVLVAIAIGRLGISPGRSPAVFAIGGFVSGLMGTISAIHGLPLVVLYQRAGHAVARATIAAVFVLAALMALASLHVQNLFGHSELVAGLELVPGLAAGFVVAHYARTFMSAKMALKLMVAIASISAIVLIVKSADWP